MNKYRKRLEAIAFIEKQIEIEKTMLRGMSNYFGRKEKTQSSIRQEFRDKIDVLNYILEKIKEDI